MRYPTKVLPLLFVFFLHAVFSFAQPVSKDTSWKNEYRATPEKIHSLIHTKLEASFDIPKANLLGKVWITLQPHFYASSVVSLDAKGMEIKEVALQQTNTRKKLPYQYDGMKLNIQMDRVYKGGEKFTLYIDYIAKPDELKTQGSAAITDAKGMYFINPRGEEKNKPTQIWTQGETEATSVWCPTIDKPNQKTTQEFYLTVPAKWVTLSNGKLMKQTLLPNGTRTDYWKMDQPHAPYLFFVGAGDFAVIKESWKGKEVSYYVDKEYADVARKIFGNTPEMMTYFSKITGVEYPWVKYGQLVGRDYVSGAMENTTATIHQASAQQDARELVDGNIWEGTIAHELFHQWFGDYVTTESWSNLTVNESFANYSEFLWDEYKYGKDKAEATHFEAMQGYLMSGSEKKDLVRFYYPDKEEMFDAVSYNKGGRILHMLRKYVGDSAFFKSLNHYLTTNKYKAAEAHQLRLSFEEVTGKDLNWFFNQWYFGSGHPRFDINYNYDEGAKKVKVLVTQTQTDKVFRVPVSIDVFEGSNKTRHDVWVTNKIDSFYFDADTKPDLVNFDGDKILLCTRKENKTFENYIHQYRFAGNLIDRREAIDFIAKRQQDEKAVALLKEALRDPFADLRRYTIGKLDLKKGNVAAAIENELQSIANNDKSRLVKARAIEVLGNTKNESYKALYELYLNDSSYNLSGAALSALEKIDAASALEIARNMLSKKSKGLLLDNAIAIVMKAGDEEAFGEIAHAYDNMGLSQSKFNLTSQLANYIAMMGNTEKVKEGVDLIAKFRDAIPEQFGIGPVIDNMLKSIITKKEASLKQTPENAELKTQIEYIQSKMQKK
ncbi:MAG: M1 family aminopeptidase [Chitinophagaceae bacterium]